MRRCRDCNKIYKRLVPLSAGRCSECAKDAWIDKEIEATNSPSAKRIEELEAEVARLREALDWALDRCQPSGIEERNHGDYPERFRKAVALLANKEAIAAVRPSDKPTGDEWQACAERLAKELRDYAEVLSGGPRTIEALAEFDRLQGKEGV